MERLCSGLMGSGEGPVLRELHSYDELLASDVPFQYSVEKLFQGQVADALTHVGQIAMLRRLAGCPIRTESFFPAEIVIGRVGPDQAPAKMPL